MHFKLLRIMHLTAFIIVAFALTASASGRGQTVSISGKDLPIRTVFNEIEKQTGYVFLFSYNSLKNAVPITVHLRNEELLNALDSCFKNQPFGYLIKDKTIIVKAKSLADHLSVQLLNSHPPITVRGRIVNEKGEAVVASVVVKGTNKGSKTDDYGNFELNNVDDNATLIISGIGIETQEINIRGRTEINITTFIKIGTEEEVTFNGGYYTTTDKKRTGNIGKVTAKDIEKQTISSPLMVLQGRVAGVSITPTAGAAGAVPVVQIRGKNSLRSNGNYPLYVIDGVQIDSRPLQTASSSLLVQGLDPLVMISPSDIESIEVLKDGDATAIYGSRGANGVILITTKNARQRESKEKVELNLSKGFRKLKKQVNLLNTEQYLAMRNEAFENDNATPQFYDYDVNGSWNQQKYTDWQKELLGKTADITDVQLALTGGNKQTSFRLAGAYHREGTIYSDNFNFQTITGSFSLNHTSLNKKFNSSFSVVCGTNDNKQFDGDLVNAAYRLSPNAPDIYNPDGTLNWAIVNTAAGTFVSWKNPFSYLLQTHDISGKNLQIDASISYKILPELLFKVQLGLTNLQQEELIKQPISAIDPIQQSFLKGSAIFGNNDRDSWIAQPQLEYDKQFAAHHLNVLFGSTLQNSKYAYRSIKGEGYESDELLKNLLFASVRTFMADADLQYRYNSLYTRIGYDFLKKYFANLTVRRDGSSRFGPGKKNGNFGAIGLGWIFSQESFLQRSSWLSFGKLRFSYGIAGNDQIDDYVYIDNYSTPQGGGFYQGGIVLNPLRLFNPDYRWEETRKFEAGLQLGFFQDKINAEISYYCNRSGNQLIAYSVPITAGFESYLANFPAVVQNTGWEFLLKSNIIQTKKLTWQTSANLTIPRNKLAAFPGIESSSYAAIFKVGESVDVKNFYNFERINQATGKPVFTDYNGDGNFTSDDMRLVPGARINWYGGWSNEVMFAKFDISFLIQYSNGVGINSWRGLAGSNLNFNTEVLHRWQKPGDDTNIPAFSQSGDSYTTALMLAQSNYLLEKSSFFRLQNVSVGYSLPQRWFRHTLNSARFFVNAQNLLTITSFGGSDPEVINGAIPQLLSVTGGIQLKF